jgi:nitrite reductase (NO-forming)
MGRKMQTRERDPLLGVLSSLAVSLLVGAGLLASTAVPVAADEMEVADVVRDPADVPPPIGSRGPGYVKVNLEVQELAGQLDDGTTYRFWTYNGQIPGPLIRARVGDTVEVRLENSEDSWAAHSIDLHAVNGPFGGARATDVDPGQARSFKFKALSPGLYIYHCGTPMVAHHISSGLYGLILIEPEGGLPEVDREFYIVQGEVYTAGEKGDGGMQEVDLEKLLDEQPEYVTFNGTVGSLTAKKPMHATAGETVRIFFGVAGPNMTSAFHVIGEMFDKVYSFGGTTSVDPNIQTVPVPPGGTTFVDFKIDVPGTYVIVDHALSRLERGAAGLIIADGEDDPEIFTTIPAETN